MAGDFRGALSEFPSTYREERGLLSYLLRAGENYSGAKRKLGDSARKLYHTAYQSFLFNLVLVERLRATGGDLGVLFQGDIAFLHRNGAVFYVEDPEREAPRAAAFEISPSGPIFGMKMPFPLGREGEIEGQVLATEEIRASDFHQLMPKLKLEGGRRPFRVRVEDLKVQFEGNDLFLEFYLPKGSYATVLLREVMKNEVVPDGFYEDGEGEKYGLWRPGAPSRIEAVAEMGPHLDPDD
jgi:tRNA pseudouridine13 synthase